MEESIVNPFAPILVESTRSIGYSFESAIADIIDNSISANANNINIFFSPYNDPYLCVLDDGDGMDKSELGRAMRYGSRNPLEDRPNTDMGRFGMGLKTASLSQCRQLTVISKKENNLHACQWDIDLILERKDWVLLSFNEDELGKFPQVHELETIPSGTLVVWKKFDKLFQGSPNIEKVLNSKIDTARDHLALIFHRFLSGEALNKKINISINNLKISPIDPFLSKHPATQPLVEQKISIEGKDILVKPYILPHINKLSIDEIAAIGGKDNLRRNQGFYVYRNKRLIIWGTWFKLVKQEELSKLARIRVDIPNSLDYIWEIDIKKSTATLPQIVKDNLINIIDIIIERSKRVHTYRGRITNDSSILQMWDKIQNREGFKYSINREHPAFKILVHKLDQVSLKDLEVLLDLIEESFPYQDVYLDIAKGNKTEEKDDDYKEKIYDMALQMIQGAHLLTGGVNAFIESLPKQEPFSRYPDVVNRIKKEVTLGGK